MIDPGVMEKIADALEMIAYWMSKDGRDELNDDE